MSNSDSQPAIPVAQDPATAGPAVVVDAVAAPTEAVQAVTDAVGDLIAFWGFPRSYGRIWALLYLADTPLSAAHLGEALDLSAGQISTSLRDLEQWEVVHPQRLSGERRTRYIAETNLFRMVHRVFQQRELGQIRQLASALQRAKQELERELAASNVTDPAREARLKRVQSLIAAAELGRSMVERLVAGTLLPKALMAALDRPLVATTPPQ